MSSTRKTAVVAGVFFLITEVTSIAALALYHPVLHDSGYILGAGSDRGVLLGGLLEVLLAIANIGTAVTLYPVVKRQNPSLALGYVCGRLLESVVIVVGIISVLSVVTLRQNLGGDAGADSTTLVTVGRSLVAIHDWTFLLGPALILGVNSLMLAYLLDRSRLVPRWITTLGMVGGPLVSASAVAVLFGVFDQTSSVGLLAALPVFAWEVSVAIYMIAKGFKPVAASRTVPSLGLRAGLSPA
jgi:hypothetical protein